MHDGLHISRPIAPPYSLITFPYQRNLRKLPSLLKVRIRLGRVLLITSGSSLLELIEKYPSVAKETNSYNIWEDDSKSIPRYTFKLHNYLFRMPTSCLNKPI